MKKIFLFLGCYLLNTSIFAVTVCLEPEYQLSEKCPSDTPFLSTDGNCYGCDNPNRMAFRKEHKKDFEICQNRENVEASLCHGLSNYSRLKTCPEIQPLRSVSDNCFSCDDINSKIPIADERDCYVCSNRKIKKQNNMNFCSLKKCPTSLPLQGEHCISCEERINVPVDEKEYCQICSNREVEKWADGYHCRLKECPNDYPIRLWNGDCTSCFDKKEWEFSIVTKDNCAKCPNREYVDKKCRLRKGLK